MVKTSQHQTKRMKRSEAGSDRAVHELSDLGAQGLLQLSCMLYIFHPFEQLSTAEGNVFWFKSGVGVHWTKFGCFHS